MPEQCLVKCSADSDRTVNRLPFGRSSPVPSVSWVIVGLTHAGRQQRSSSLRDSRLYPKIARAI